MAVPKRKVSKSRRDKRRTHQKIDGPNVAKCPQCGEPIMQHHACRECGAYRGKNVLEKNA
jgi:large subunit ribosomal protein L32